VQLLLTSDLHYNLRQYDWLVSVADQFDVVVVAGDHLDISSAVALKSQSVVVLRYLARLAQRTTVIASSGNHDLTTRNRHGEKVAGWLAEGRMVGALVDGDSLELDGIRITVCPWWDGPSTREELDARLREEAHDRPRYWVWVYHPPPAGSPTALGGGREYGDHDLRAWMNELRPDVVLTGHVHEAPFVSGGAWFEHTDNTWTFNPGRVAIGSVPNHVVLDLDARVASWYGGGESEELALDQSPAQ
jgi:Icc-related predicted phosphoesterase